MARCNMDTLKMAERAEFRARLALDCELNAERCFSQSRADALQGDWSSAWAHLEALQAEFGGAL